MFYSELYKKLGVTNRNVSIIKCLLNVLKENEMIVFDKQEIRFSEISWQIFEKMWKVYEKTEEVCDHSHMSKVSFTYFFQLLYSGMILKEKITVYGIFCPGYEGTGYKMRLGSTTLEKMNSLKIFSNIMESYGIENEIVCIYADAFLENEIRTKKNRDEFECNKSLFLNKSISYFKQTMLLSDFLGNGNVRENSFIDQNIVKSVNKQVYKKFLNCNKKFYGTMGWSMERIEKRTDELITLYVIVADKMHEKKNSIYATIENIEERTSLFLSKQIPVLFISKMG